MKILFAASECVPFVKTGGLADVVGALPKELCKNGADVRVILPLYRTIGAEWREKMEFITSFYVDLGWRHQYVGLFKLALEGVTYYFIDNLQYFDREYVYGMGGDEGERFAYFARAVLEALPKLDFIPDVLHCHDWQTGMIPALYKAQYRQLELYRNIKTVFTIHNLKFQGVFPIGEIENLLSLGDWAYTSANLEFFGMCSFMKGGLVFADEITTDSHTYAEEIQTAYYARVDHLCGILNGIDVTAYDPEHDPAIEKNYTFETFDLKKEDKLALQRELGLKEDASAPIIGMVSRLSGQKGFDLVECVLNEIMATGAQLAVLGMGESKYVDLFSWAQWKYVRAVRPFADDCAALWHAADRARDGRSARHGAFLQRIHRRWKRIYIPELQRARHAARNRTCGSHVSRRSRDIRLPGQARDAGPVRLGSVGAAIHAALS